MNPSISVKPPEDGEPEEPLIERVQAGDQQAFEKLYARHAAEVHTFIAGRVADAAAAEDIAADTWEVACRSIRRFTGGGRPFVPWVIGIARYQLLTHLARDRRHQSLDKLTPE